MGPPSADWRAQCLKIQKPIEMPRGVDLGETYIPIPEHSSCNYSCIKIATCINTVLEFFSLTRGISGYTAFQPFGNPLAYKENLCSPYILYATVKAGPEET